MTYLLRNLVLLHVLLLVLFLTWVHGGTRADHLQSVPWLLLLLLNVLVALPPTRKGESLPEARQRVWRGLRKDPLLYIGLCLNGLLLLQWINGGHAPEVHAGAGSDNAARLWLPFSVSSAESIQQLYWFPSVTLAVLAVRHGVPRAGQRRLLLDLIWGGAALAAFGWIQWISGTQSLFWITPLSDHFFASFGYENHAGAFFTLLFAVSGGIWFQACMDKDEKVRAHWYLVPMLLNASGAFGSISRAAMLLTMTILVVGGGFALWASWKRVQLGTRVKAITYAGLVIAVSIGLYFAFPDGLVRKKLDRIHISTFYEDTIGGRMYQYQSAWAMTKDHPLFGVGGWGYRHFVHQFVTPEILEKMAKGAGQANVHNDTLQFLAEHGLVGFGLMLSVAIVLLVPILRGAWRMLITPPLVDWDNPYYPPLQRVPAVIYAVLAGTLATVIHSMIDLPFRSPAILVTWGLCLACAPAFMPRAVVASGTKVKAMNG